MNNTFFLLASILYFIITTAISFSIYLGFKRLSKTNNQAVSATSRLYAYRKITGIWMGSIIFWIMMAELLFGNYINQTAMMCFVVFFIILFFVYYLTVFRKNTIKLTENIKEVNPKVGNVIEFTSGFSKNTGNEMLKLFIILLIGIGLIIALVFSLIKYNLI